MSRTDLLPDEVRERFKKEAFSRGRNGWEDEMIFIGLRDDWLRKNKEKKK